MARPWWRATDARREAPRYPAWRSTGGSNYPATYNNALFFTDYSRRCLWVMLPGTGGDPNPANILPFEELQSRYYLRVLAKDQPGVMARVAAVLGKYEVSISAILQHESGENNHVPIVITTHMAKEGALQRAIHEINSLPVIQPPAACLRIIDQPKESAAIR